MRVGDLEWIIADPGPRINDLEMFWNSVAFRLQAVIWDALEISSLLSDIYNPWRKAEARRTSTLVFSSDP